VLAINEHERELGDFSTPPTVADPGGIEDELPVVGRSFNALDQSSQNKKDEERGRGKREESLSM
jgi:hypothetical protein